MIVRALTSTGDWTYGSGKNNYLSANAAVAQSIATRLLSFLGDCFFATNAGLDWWTFLGGSKDQLALQLAINATILNTENVTGIVITNVLLNHLTRAFTISYTVTTTFGNVEGVVLQNLGIAPIAPGGDMLLPQFNQTLLNNVGATVINGAKFDPLLFWGVDLGYFIERRDATPQSFVQRGILSLRYQFATSLWTIDDFILGGSSGPTTGVAFTIDSSTGQAFYGSDNMTGGSYVGNLIVQSLATFKAGL
jgi:hypothetical protein